MGHRCCRRSRWATPSWRTQRGDRRARRGLARQGERRRSASTSTCRCTSRCSRSCSRPSSRGIRPVRRAARRTASGSRIPTGVPRNLYRCADGRWIVVSGHHRPAGGAHPRSSSVLDDRRGPRQVREARPTASRNADELDALVAEWVGRTPMAEADRRRSSRAGCPTAPVHDVPGILADPHIACAREPHHRARRRAGRRHARRTVAEAGRDAGHRCGFAGPPIGAHNDEVYGRLLGLTPAELVDLRQHGVI